MSVLFRQRFSLLLRRHTYFDIAKHVTVTGNTQVDKAMDVMTGGKLGGMLKSYEDLVGLTEVREAQDKVIQAERKFLDTQSERRSHQIELVDVQSKLKDIHHQLDKVQRGDENYLALLTEEYGIIKEEKAIQGNLQNFETRERDLFASLSSSVRESHEKERARTERTKYWSIMGSVIGAAIGILGTSINNYLRMRELRHLVKQSSSGGIELKGVVEDLSNTVEKQSQQISSFVGDLKSITGSGKGDGHSTQIQVPTATLTPSQLQDHTKEILSVIQQQDESLAKDMTDLKNLLSAAYTPDASGKVVYVGAPVEELMEQTEKNLEWKIKLGALWTVTLVYGALAITLPVLYTIFRGN